MSELESDHCQTTECVLSQPTAAVCHFCSVSHLRREVAAYFSQTFTEMKQITERTEIIKALGEECTKFALELW